MDRPEAAQHDVRHQPDVEELISMSNAATAGTFVLGHRRVNRLGYGAMQLAGPGVFGPPRDKTAREE
jgi:hypothetical protein